VAKVRLLDPTDSKRRLDRYELIGELASGGMATVYLGRLGGVGGFQRFVAIKRLHPHLASEEEFIEMFLDEARLAAGIHHPHVVPILEVGESDSGYYLVMEYIEGDTLARLMARGLARANPVPRPVLIRIILDTLSGLHAAHELVDPHGEAVHLVHRDVSPQNILVGVDGCSRITDFGVAHAASRLQNTRADRLKGKLAYMSPEQARAAEIDRRSDVFAMGIILWEVLAAKRLFRAETEAITLQKVTNEPIPRLSAVLPGVHPALEQVCAKALERDPNRRYKSAAEMAEALERAARAAASASATDLGVASPREVAAYVQGALGEDIAAQRESVRAWLAHSEPSLPRYTGVKPERPDVTVRMPLDQPADRPRAVRDDRSGPRSTSGISSVSAISSSSIPRATASEPSSGGMSVAAALGLAAEPRIEQVPAQHADGADASESPVEPVADDDDEHETLLMDREAQGATIEAFLAVKKGGAAAAPAPAARPAPSAPPRAFAEEGTPSASIESVTVMPDVRKPSRVPQVVAAVVALLLGIGGVAVWWQMRAGSAAANTGPRAAPTAEPTATATATVQVAAATAPAPTAQPAPSAAPTSEATPINALPNVPATHGPRGPLPKGKPTATAAAAPEPPKPADPPKPAEPAKPPEDMANPYR
jgi:serine/threonine-protein kinase